MITWWWAAFAVAFHGYPRYTADLDLASRSEGDLDGIATHFIGRAELLRNTEHTGRGKDLGDAQELRKRDTDQDG